jgi:hypothetical protein
MRTLEEMMLPFQIGYNIMMKQYRWILREKSRNMVKRIRTRCQLR